MFSTAMSSSSSTAAVSRASPEEHFWQLTAEESSSSLSEALPFSSGNPRIEETRGVMHLFSNDAVSDLPVCMLSVYVCVFGFDDEINDC